MKKIKITYNLLSKVLGQVMIEPSIITILKGGHIKAYGSDWNLELTETKLFKRRKILRLIRKFWKTHEIVILNDIVFYNIKTNKKRKTNGNNK